ncbi:facilitated trehalose transporter Tret1-like [Lutzomyia longipalpis]|uniref:facilitated trehalose transporter Tret1-like n=1 Tax=Lutzomyia longipalpis TaxID=7200 RepID=UPI002483D78C|nr:facilitated trehalose transporter Tret1-like [Lutzomyia longipalpis]
MFIRFSLTSHQRQYLLGFVANFSTLMYGISVGWVSPTIPLLMSEEETPLPIGAITKRQASLISALLYISGLVGSLCFGWVADRLGRKWALYLGTIPHVIAYLLIIFAADISYLYISRCLSGLGCGALFVALPIYVSEVSEDKIRGGMGAIFCNMVSIGIVTGRAFGSYLDFYVVPYGVLGILAIFIIVFPFFPETPQYLLLRQRHEAAEKSLRFLRGVSQNLQIPLPPDVREELEALKNSPTLHNQNKRIKMEDLKPKTTRRAILISLILISGRSLCGVLPLDNYTATVLMEAGSHAWSPNLSALIVGVFELIGSNLAIICVDRGGRRWNLLVSSGGSAVSIAILGAVFFVKSFYGVESAASSWLAVVSLSAFMTLAAIGVVAIPFSVSAEVLPPKLRSPVSTTFMLLYWAMTFVIVDFFLIFGDHSGMYTPLWMCGAWCTFELIFVYFYLPETKGKSFDQVEMELKGKKRKEKEAAASPS